MPLELNALNGKNFEAFASLMGEIGGCYCAVWTSYDDTWVQRCNDPAQPNLEITRRLVDAKSHIGYLVYDHGELVGWTGAGPKEKFPFLAQKLASRLTPSAADTWSISCLAVKETARGSGMSQKIISAVLDKAKANGAAVVEAYPTRPWDEPRSFRGSWTSFERLGFKVTGSERDGESEILLMRRELN